MAKAAQMVKHGKIERLSYSRINEVMEMPNFIEIQKNSYQWFLDKGLKEVFRDIDTITDYTGNLELSFIDFRMDDKPKYTIKECKDRRNQRERSLYGRFPDYDGKRHLRYQRCGACYRFTARPFPRCLF